MSNLEHASTDGLADTLSRLIPALEGFTEFRGPDPAAQRSSWLPLLDEPLPVTGTGSDAVIALLEDIVIGKGLRIGHPGFTGWVTNMPTTIATAADLAQTVASPQRWWVHPGNYLDSLAVEWMAELLGFPMSHIGQFTSGGSSANLVGLGAARQHAAEQLGIDPSRDGVAAMRRPRAYVSGMTHHVIQRSLAVLGLGRESARTVPLAADRRADLDALRSMMDEDRAAGCTPVAVVGNAGDVNTGIVDPLGKMADIAHERGVWFHVDGAYGGFGLLDERVRPLYGDPGEYDSFVIDPHKWLAAPVGTGLVLCKDGDLLARSFAVETGAYDRERSVGVDVTTDPASPWESTGRGTPDWGVDFSTPSRGIAVWAILKEIGAEGMRSRVSRHLDCARLVADRARATEELQLLTEPVLSICCFRYVPRGWKGRDEELDALNENVLAELRSDGKTVPSGTWVDGRFAIRPCFINPRSGLDEAAALVDAVLDVGRRAVSTTR